MARWQVSLIKLVGIIGLNGLLYLLSSNFFDLIDDVAALLKRQGVNVKGLLKVEPVKEEPQPHIDCTGHLQVFLWTNHSQKSVPL